MKNLAKLLSLILALALVFALVGCEKSSDDDDDDDSKPSSGAVDKDNDKDDDKDDSKSSKPSKEDKDDEDEKDSIVGVWEAEFEMGDMVKEMLGDNELVDYMSFDELNSVLVLEFDDDDNCTISYDLDSVEDLYDNMMDAIMDACVARFEELADDADMTVDEYLEENGTSLDEIEEQMMEAMPRDNFVDQYSRLVEESTYELDGDTIIIGGKNEYEYTGKKIIAEIEGVRLEFKKA